VNLGFGGDDTAQQRLRPFNMDGEIIVDKKTAVWPSLYERELSTKAVR
jgi:hypothetical protein